MSADISDRLKARLAQLEKVGSMLGKKFKSYTFQTKSGHKLSFSIYNKLVKEVLKMQVLACQAGNVSTRKSYPNINAPFLIPDEVATYFISLAGDEAPNLIPYLESGIANKQYAQQLIALATGDPEVTSVSQEKTLVGGKEKNVSFFDVRDTAAGREFRKVFGRYFTQAGIDINHFPQTDIVKMLEKVFDRAGAKSDKTAVSITLGGKVLYPYLHDLVAPELPSIGDIVMIQARMKDGSMGEKKHTVKAKTLHDLRRRAMGRALTKVSGGQIREAVRQALAADAGRKTKQLSGRSEDELVKAAEEYVLFSRDSVQFSLDSEARAKERQKSARKVSPRKSPHEAHVSKGGVLY